MNFSKTYFRAVLIALTFFVFGGAVFGQQEFTYLVNFSPPRPANPGRLSVWIVAKETIKDDAVFVIPRAIPSGYGIQRYDRFLEVAAASSPGGGTIAVTKLEDGPRWSIAKSKQGVEGIFYYVDLNQLESEVLSAADQSKSRPDYAGLLGYSVFGYFDGYQDYPVRLRVNGPSDWPIFTTLAPRVPAELDKTEVEAKNYFELADSQIAMGPGLKLMKLATKPPSYIALYSETKTDLDKHAQVFERAFRKVVDYFGDAPFDSYTAHIEILKPKSELHSYGFSMEHSKSGTFYLGLDRAYTEETPEAEFVRDELNFIHHIAHSWIPKKVYGKGYLPFTWELPPLIDTVWFNEGFARFAMIEIRADSMPADEGKAWRERYLASLKEFVESQPAFIRDMSLQELSRIGSVMYSEDFRTGRTLFSKGALMADEIDRLIRERTNGKKRLRDSLRAMVKWGVENKRPFALEELPGLIAKPVGVKESEVREVMERWLAPGPGR
ncbi:MAG: hypothetical protein J5I65_01685 [Aridibacter famidurans]|nr:hypothetical protein [Aridibacter famidurans]